MKTHLSTSLELLWVWTAHKYGNPLFASAAPFYLPLSPGEACTIVLRGATQQILDEAERSLHDALCVLAQTVKEPRTVYGGGVFTVTLVQVTKLSFLTSTNYFYLLPFVCPSPGCSEMLMAKVVTDLANRTPGKEAVAMESFAKALRMVGL